MQPTKTNLQNKSTNEQQGSVGANATRSMPSVPVLQKVAPEEELLQKKPNNTGLPDNLKSGVENLSGISMDDVKVHYNSSKPSQLQALAYAQGTDIHVAPGQEQHLPHEAWHVVQQKQGRVQPTMQMQQGVAVNDDKGLESEADMMGGKAVQMKSDIKTSIGFVKNQHKAFVKRKINEIGEKRQQVSQLSQKNVFSENPSSQIIQRRTEITYNAGAMTYWTSGLHTNNLTVGIGTDALLDPADPKTGSRTAPAPHPSPYTNGNWPTLYQGHLLNANLGGQAIPQNLFPVTPAFNGQHSSVIEDSVKAELLNLNALQNNPVTRPNYINRRLHYSVEAINPNIVAPFRPLHIRDTVFRCTKEYTQNNIGPGLGTGIDHTLNHDQLDLNVPAPADLSLNSQLENIGWAPAAAPTYYLGVHPGVGYAPNVRNVRDGIGGPIVPNVLINT